MVDVHARARGAARAGGRGGGAGALGPRCAGSLGRSLRLVLGQSAAPGQHALGDRLRRRTRLRGGRLRHGAAHRRRGWELDRDQHRHHRRPRASAGNRCEHGGHRRRLRAATLQRRRAELRSPAMDGQRRQLSLSDRLVSFRRRRGRLPADPRWERLPNHGRRPDVLATDVGTGDAERRWPTSAERHLLHQRDDRIRDRPRRRRADLSHHRRRQLLGRGGEHQSAALRGHVRDGDRRVRGRQRQQAPTHD